MSYEPESNNRTQAQPQKPQVSSYDSGYEHSFEHFVALRMLVDEDEDQGVSDRPKEMVVAA